MDVISRGNFALAHPGSMNDSAYIRTQVSIVFFDHESQTRFWIDRQSFLEISSSRTDSGRNYLNDSRIFHFRNEAGDAGIWENTFVHFFIREISSFRSVFRLSNRRKSDSNRFGSTSFQQFISSSLPEEKQFRRSVCSRFFTSVERLLFSCEISATSPYRSINESFVSVFRVE